MAGKVNMTADRRELKSGMVIYYVDSTAITEPVKAQVLSSVAGGFDDYKAIGKAVGGKIWFSEGSANRFKDYIKYRRRVNAVKRVGAGGNYRPAGEI